MSVEVDFQITGLDEALDRLGKLPAAMRRKGLPFAMRRAANLVRNAARENAKAIDDPDTARSIAANIAVRYSSRTFRRTGDVVFRVGVLGGARQYGQTRANVRRGRAGKSYRTEGDRGNPGGDTWYWRLVELGTRRTRAKPFMRPALRDNVAEATSEAATQLSRWLDRNVGR